MVNPWVCLWALHGPESENPGGILNTTVVTTHVQQGVYTINEITYFALNIHHFTKNFKTKIIIGFSGVAGGLYSSKTPGPQLPAKCRSQTLQ